jgi:hypothetical protein
MTKGIPYDEAKRRRAEREAAKRAEQQQQQNRNGNGAVRHLKRANWTGLGPIGLHDRLVRGIMGERQLVMIYGESGSGKSFLAFDMAAHIALGWPWMGRVVTPGAVLYVAAEGTGGWANRVEAFCQHHQLDHDQRERLPFNFILSPVNLGPRDGSQDVAAIVQAAADLSEESGEQVRAIVIDTMARATPGSNENDPLDVGAFVGKCDAIRDQTGASPLIVHHAGKNLSAGARGHSALRAAVDCELEVERSDTQRLLRLKKSRDGVDGTEIGFALLPVEIGRQGDDVITSCVVQSAAIDESQKAAKPHRVAKWELSQDVLHNTLADFPELPPHGINAITCTTIDHLKAALRRASIIDSPEPSRQRGQWKEIKDGLTQRKIMGIDEVLGLVWRIGV